MLIGRCIKATLKTGPLYQSLMVETVACQMFTRDFIIINPDGYISGVATVNNVYGELHSLNSLC